MVTASAVRNPVSAEIQPTDAAETRGIDGARPAASTNAGWDASEAADSADFRPASAAAGDRSLRYGADQSGAPARPAADVEREARPRPTSSAELDIWDLAATVVDPEVPVLTIEDLGVLRGVRLEGGSAVVEITPTYSGCPAVEAIRADIRAVLADAGVASRVDVVLSPAWTTDWMSADGRRKLEEFGIAAPRPRGSDGAVTLGLGIRCPQCGSMHTRELSRFGSTSCKALWECRACGEPFDRFKEL